MEFISTAILIVGMLFLTFIAVCVLLIVTGMCLPLFGIPAFRLCPITTRQKMAEEMTFDERMAVDRDGAAR